MRVLVCGQKDWSDRRRVRRVLDALKDVDNELTIIRPEHPGAAMIAGSWAAEHEVERVVIEPVWRNPDGRGMALKMIEDGDPDLIIAFHANVNFSQTTQEVIDLADRKGIALWLLDRRPTEASKEE